MQLEARARSMVRLSFFLLLSAWAALTTPCRGAPMDGYESAFTQPDGTRIRLRFYGDEFYARAETEDGYTVAFDPIAQCYEYAAVEDGGRRLTPSGLRVGRGRPEALGLARHLDIDPPSRRAIAKARFDAWDRVTGTSRRWDELKEQLAAQDAAATDQDGTEEGPSSAPPSFTTTGTKVGLTLLVDFPDVPGTIARAEIISFCNSDSYSGYGNNGSVKKYYQDNSNNLLTYTNVVTVYIRMAQPKSYYNDTSVDNGICGRLLINDALAIMKALPNYGTEILPTFNSVTVDGSNRVIALNVFFAGGNSGVWSYGLWPHSWSLASAVPLSAGGKSVYRYQITDLGSSLSLGTFCHENGHMLCGFPDIYDYDYDSKGGAGGFCLMGTGGHGTNPVLINGYLKRAAGWVITTDITYASALTASLTATVGHADYNRMYRFANPAAPTTEYFLLENRQKSGRDANIAASGIAIWHVDQLGSRDNQSRVRNTVHANYELTLIQADNLWHFNYNSNAGDSKDLYYLNNSAAGYANTFSDTVLPDANWWSGDISGLWLRHFSSAGPTMTFDVGLPPNTIAVLGPRAIDEVYIRTTETIRWAASIAGDVSIELLKGGTLHTVLSSSAPNTGSYVWSVSNKLPVDSDYSIRISSVDSPALTDTSDATFTIRSSPPTLADALDTVDLTWTTSGSQPWFAQSLTTKDGVDAARSGAISHSQASYLETTLAGPGTLTFWWQVSSEASYDYLRFYLNDVEQSGRISGVVNWTQKSVSIPAGSCTVKWGYTKDDSASANADAAWVDQVVYTPLSTAEIAVEQPAGNNLVDGSASVACGTVMVGQSGAPITFMIRNTGLENLTGLALSVSGTHGAEFIPGSLGATTIAPGASTTFTVTFTPVATGARSAVLQISSNDSDENPFDIALTGTGATAGNLVVTPAGGLTATGTYGGPFAPSALEYTLSNSGGTAINWTAAKGAGWVGLSAAGGTLAAGQSTPVTVSINSSAETLNAGSHSDTVLFTNTSNGQGNGTRGVSLTVSQAVPVVSVWPTGSVLAVGQPLSASTLSGGSASVAGAFAFSAPQTVPPLGLCTAAVIFAAADAINYAPVSGTASVQVIEPSEWHVLPFHETFETLSAGNLDGQHGWVADGAEVQSALAYGGSGKAASVTSAGGYIRHTFNDGRTRVWTDLRVRIVRREEVPAPDADSTVAFFVSTNDHVMVFDGVQLKESGAVAREGEWVRFTVFSDYVARMWTLYVNSALAGRFQFFDATAAGYRECSVSGKSTFIDRIGLTLERPAMGGATILIW